MFIPLLLMLIYCLCAAFKVLTQSIYSKSNINSVSDTLIFWTYIFFVIGIFFVPFTIVNHEFSKVVLIYAILNGVFSLLYQLFYTLSFKYGSVSLSVFFTSASSVLCIVYSLIVFKEPLTPCKIIGFVLFTIALLLNIKKDQRSESSPNKLKYILCVVMASASLIVCSIVSKYLAVNLKGAYQFGFLSISYILAFILCLIIVLIIRFKNKNTITIIPNKKYFLFGSICSLFLIVCVFLNQYITTISDVSLYYPIRGGLCMIFGISLSWIFHKERPTTMQLIGMIAGLASVILVNF